MATKQPQRPHFLPEWMEARSVTTTMIARDTGLDKSMIGRYLKGASPQVPAQEKLAAFFGIRAESLFRHPDEAWFLEFIEGRSLAEIAHIKTSLEATFPRGVSTQDGIPEREKNSRARIKYANDLT
jgi:transcriptional regulator with XRE-family HTH domain